MTVFSEHDVADLRADLGDIGNRWKVEELEQLLDRAQRRYAAGTAQQWVDIACAMGLAQLLSNAAKFNDYVIAEEQQKKSDIWRQMNGTYQNKLLMGHVKAALNIEGGSTSGIQQQTLGYQRTRGSGDEFASPGH